MHWNESHAQIAEEWLEEWRRGGRGFAVPIACFHAGQVGVTEGVVLSSAIESVVRTSKRFGENRRRGAVVGVDSREVSLWHGLEIVFIAIGSPDTPQEIPREDNAHGGHPEGKEEFNGHDDN